MVASRNSYARRTHQDDADDFALLNRLQVQLQQLVEGLHVIGSGDDDDEDGSTRRPSETSTLANARIHVKLLRSLEDLRIGLRDDATQRRLLLLRDVALRRLVLRSQHPPAAVGGDVADIGEADAERRRVGAEGLGDQIADERRFLLLLLHLRGVAVVLHVVDDLQHQLHALVRSGEKNASLTYFHSSLSALCLIERMRSFRSAGVSPRNLKPAIFITMKIASTSSSVNRCAHSFRRSTRSVDVVRLNA